MESKEWLRWCSWHKTSSEHKPSRAAPWQLCWHLWETEQSATDRLPYLKRQTNVILSCVSWFRAEGKQSLKHRDYSSVSPGNGLNNKDVLSTDRFLHFDSSLCRRKHKNQLVQMQQLKKTLSVSGHVADTCLNWTPDTPLTCPTPHPNACGEKKTSLCASDH